MPTLLIVSYGYHLLLKFYSDKKKSKFSKWINFFIISLIILYINYLAFDTLSQINSDHYSLTYPIIGTFVMYVFRGIYMILDKLPFEYFKSNEDDTKIAITPPRIYKKVEERDADKIPIYPRITIRDINVDADDWKNPKKIIFDSSDFTIINKTFGVFNDLQESFKQGKKFKFKDTELIAEIVQVDFMSIYDDYSGGLLGKHHTEVYEGKDTPYNLQIIVWARIPKANS